MEIINTFKLTNAEEEKIIKATEVVDEIIDTLNNNYWKKGRCEPYECPEIPKCVLELCDKLLELV